MAQLFLYREGAAMTPEDLDALRAAGLVPIKVAQFDDVRIVDPIMAAGSAGAVWRAAVEAIHRNQMVKMWRAAGVPCFQVAEGELRGYAC